MNKKINSLLIVVLLLVNINLIAQKAIGNQLPEVKVIATATKKSIMLRWGVTTPTAWKYANKYGYTIERKTIVRDKQVLPNPEVKQLVTVPLKPKPMMEWKEFTEKNNNAAIAAQALYGEQFDVNMNEGGNGVISIINQAQAFEQRFTFALYAADQDFEVAKFSGLAFIDTSVKANERYLYSIKVVLPKEKKYKIKSGGVFLGLMDYKPLPKPQEFVGVFKNKTAILSWNFAILKRYYTNYIIEKSDNGGEKFKSLSSTPIVNMGEREKNPSNRMMYVDSLFQNNKEYKYRIKGISPFGIQGPYSNIVAGKGITPLVHTPFLTDLSFQDNGDVILNWKFPSEGINTLKSFELVRANKPKGVYLTVKKQIVKNQRAIRLSRLQPISYYKIVGIGYDGSRRESFPKMVQPDDSTPPATPTLLSGTIDSLGVVKLNWKQNTEVDFLGYRVFKANLKTDEFTQITFEPTPFSNFIDTVNIKTLNKKIYYKIQSFDKRYNPSGFSDVLELDRPDIVPPTSPVFSSFKTDKGKVNLNWITSTSKDAKVTMLYRKEHGAGLQWQLIAELPLPQNKYVDATGIASKTYLYTILTVDNSGLESEPVTPLKIKVLDNLSKPSIDKFTGEVNREQKFIQLNWNYKQVNVSEFVLYKASEGKRPTMYKVFKSKTKKFRDKNLLINTKYTYILQAVFTSGVKSPLKKIELNY
ncbi:fibronectin type III domain-containing protein [Tenacibaculum halocynthiae]|uniref:hypothetical protein n=1 Tax=Tenacibaculum halocynthiae TaxID=1254437 RepID=UPI0038942F3A